MNIPEKYFLQKSENIDVLTFIFSSNFMQNIPALNKSHNEVGNFLRNISDKNRMKISAIVEISTVEARRLLSYELAKKYCCLPLCLIQDEGSSAMSVLIASKSLNLIKEIKFITGCDLLIEEYEEGILEQAITASYFCKEDSLTLVQKEVNNKFPEKNTNDVILEAVEEVPKLLEAIIFRANYLAASDIHLEPFKLGLRLRYRIDGMLRNDTSFEISKEASSNLIRRIKILSNLDITLCNKPQEGVFSLDLKGEKLSLRVSIVPQASLEKVVLRLHKDANSSMCDLEDISQLGLSFEQEKILKKYLALNSGAILSSGPTGSGKSTLLYSMLNYLNKEWRNIVTLEDPIEKTIPGINQTQVQAEGELSYQSMLPKLLRQDPDVVMLGEIRESKTAEIAFTAAMTGHLVLSTIHAGSCLEVISRLKQFNLSSDVIASSLKLVISQRLLPLNCPNCLDYQLIDLEVANFFKADKTIKLKKSKGCSLCQHTAILGRLAVFEFLPINLEMQEVFLRNSNIASLMLKLREKAFALGFVPYAYKVREALLNGKISLQTAYRVLGLAEEAME